MPDKEESPLLPNALLAVVVVRNGNTAYPPYPSSPNLLPYIGKV
jgi:hypothetical protein